ncbi:MAG: DUF1840 domain-containing protein [Gammaproteobacteria bacterium]|nr:DUF1840 domain-containing protein [Gammaproteobacteria bacterium]
MLVTFSCRVHSDITMFDEVAIHLLKLMGHSGTVPSAIRAEDVGEALRRLRAAVEAGAQFPEPEEPKEDENDDSEPPVSLAHRAMPLIRLLEAAEQAGCDVMWKSGS